MSRVCDRCGAIATTVKEIDSFIKKKYDLCYSCNELLDSMEIEFFKKVISEVESYNKNLEEANAELQEISNEEINTNDYIYKGRNITKIRYIKENGCDSNCGKCELLHNNQTFHGYHHCDPSVSKIIAYNTLCSIFDTDSITDRLYNNEKMY